MAQPVKVEISKSKDFKQVYAIGAVGGHGPYDFRIAFYNDSPKSFSESKDLQVIDRKIEVEIIISPLAAKELAKWLNAHVQDYERMFGKVEKPSETGKEPELSDSHIQGYL